MRWPFGIFDALPGDLAALHPGHPSCQGSGGYCPCTPSLPSPASCSFSWRPCYVLSMASWPLSVTQVSALLAAWGGEGQTWVGSQGYRVNGALCPFRRSQSWAKRDRGGSARSASFGPEEGWEADSILPIGFPLVSFRAEQPLGKEKEGMVAWVAAAAHVGFWNSRCLVRPKVWS